MSINPRYASALNKLFRSRPVALLNDLRRALKTRSRTTIFRILSAVGYLTSYSHAGRYYTLKRIPRFDLHGIWRYRDVGFSSHGTLRDTIVKLVETSDAGQTHQELQDVLHLRVHDTLRLLVRDRQLNRERFQDAYVYLSSNADRAARQWTQRQQLARPAAAPDPSQIIEVLVHVIRHPEEDAQAISRRLRSLGHSITPDQVEAVFARYDLKKTPRSRSPH